MGKRLVICCDGTWNTKRQTSPTNVVRFCDMIVPHGADGTEQRAFYHSGVGTGRWDRLRGGAFGFGLSRIVKDAYRILPRRVHRAEHGGPHPQRRNPAARPGRAHRRRVRAVPHQGGS